MHSDSLILPCVWGSLEIDSTESGTAGHLIRSTSPLHPSTSRLHVNLPTTYQNTINKAIFPDSRIPSYRIPMITPTCWILRCGFKLLPLYVHGGYPFPSSSNLQSPPPNLFQINVERRHPTSSKSRDAVPRKELNLFGLSWRVSWRMNYGWGQ